MIETKKTAVGLPVKDLAIRRRKNRGDSRLLLPPVSGYTWLIDPSDLDSITFEGAVTSAVGAISAIANKGSAGGSALNGTVGNRPTLGFNTFGAGMHSFINHGGARFLETTSPNDNSCTVLAALRWAGTNAQAAIGCTVDGGMEWQFVTGGAVNVLRQNVANLASCVAFAANTAPFVYGTCISTTAIRHYRNGALETDAVTVGFTGGGNLRLLHGSNGENFNGGCMGEFIVYDTTLTDAEFQLVGDYLKAKWNIA